MKKILQITTNIGCNIGCIYCPQTLLNSNYEDKLYGSVGDNLSLENFKIFLKTVPISTDIHFSGFTEPWHNKECKNMIQHAADKGHEISVFTTGYGIKTSDISLLEKIPFLKFSIHLPDAKSLMKVKLSHNHLNLLLALYYSKIKNLDFFTIGEPHPMIEQLIGVHPSSNRIHTRANNLRESHEDLYVAFNKQIVEKRIFGKPIICRKNRIYSNVLMPNGDIFLCSMDYALNQRIGTLARLENYEDIFQSPAFKKVLQDLDNPDSNIICRNCEYAVSGSYKQLLHTS